MLKNISAFMIALTVLNVNAEEKHIKLKAVSWQELQMQQLSHMISSEELSLAKVCPSSLQKIKSNFNKISTRMQHILGTNYIWTEYKNSNGEKCIIKHDQIKSLSSDN